jgi:chemotaxis protein histidine kinase CheA
VSDADLERDLRRLREAYRRKLPARLVELEALLHRARDLPEREQLESVRALAHMLKGTTGSYGFEEISHEMARIEESLGRELQKTAPDLGAARHEVGRAITRVRERLADSGNSRRRPCVEPE